MLNELLKDYGLHAVRPDNAEEPIDLEIRTQRDNLCATLWGSDPFNDIQCECDHDFVNYTDDETVGECLLCGATCDWHWEIEDGHKRQVPHDWHMSDEIGGLLGDYIKSLKENW